MAGEAWELGVVEGMTKVALSSATYASAGRQRLMQAKALPAGSPERAAAVAKGTKLTNKASTSAMKAMSSAPKSVPKPPLKMPSNLLGLGAAGIGVMALGALALKRKQPLDQPAKPKRY